MKTIKLFTTIWLVAYVGFFVQAQSPLTKKFTVVQLQADFQRMRQQLEEVHTGLYEYTPKTVMNQYFDSLYAAIKTPMTELDFLRFIKPIVVKIKNGHTNIASSLKTKTYLRTHGKFMPLKVAWLGNKLYLKALYTQTMALSPGNEILSINKQPVQSILQTLLNNFETRDGYNQTFPKHRISLHFARFYFWYISQPQEFIIKYKASPQALPKTVTIPALSRKAIAKYLKKNQNTPKKKHQKQLGFTIKNKHTGILRVSSFSKSYIKKGKQSYKKFLRKTFAQIHQKKLQNLVLDLRSNGGGDDGYGNLLFSYLTNQPFTYYKHIISQVTRINHPKYYQSTGQIRLYNLLYKGKFKKVAPGRYHLKKNEGLGTFQPQKHPFMGKLYVLINGGCFSATGEFAAYVHYRQRATFIGKETGGNYYKNTSGAMPVLVLPYTNIRVRTALMQYVMDVKGYAKGRGVIPDYIIQPTIEEVLQNKDVAMLKALELINDQIPEEKK